MMIPFLLIMNIYSIYSILTPLPEFQRIKYHQVTHGTVITKLILCLGMPWVTCNEPLSTRTWQSPTFQETKLKAFSKAHCRDFQDTNWNKRRHWQILLKQNFQQNFQLLKLLWINRNWPIGWIKPANVLLGNVLRSLTSSPMTLAPEDGLNGAIQCNQLVVHNLK